MERAPQAYREPLDIVGNSVLPVRWRKDVLKRIPAARRALERALAELAGVPKVASRGA